MLRIALNGNAVMDSDFHRSKAWLSNRYLITMSPSRLRLRPKWPSSLRGRHFFARMASNGGPKSFSVCREFVFSGNGSQILNDVCALLIPFRLAEAILCVFKMCFYQQTATSADCAIKVNPRMRLCTIANHLATSLTFSRPRTRNCCRPRLRA